MSILHSQLTTKVNIGRTQRYSTLFEFDFLSTSKYHIFGEGPITRQLQNFN